VRILITGGCGFIGSHLVEYYQNKAEVIVVDNLSSGYLKNISSFNCKFIEGDILNKSFVNNIVTNVDYVVHLAAKVSVQESMSNPETTIAANVCGLLNVLEACANSNVEKLCFASSCSIYGECPILPKVETFLPDPKSPYAITKLDGEYYCDLYNNLNKLNTVCLRFFNVFGPRQDPTSNYAAAIPNFINKALQNESLTIYGDGLQTRDFIYVKDIVSAIDTVLFNNSAKGVFNVGTEHSLTILTIAEQIKTLTNSRSEIVFHKARKGDVQHSLANTEKLRCLKWSPQYNFIAGLQETVNCLNS